MPWTWLARIAAALVFWRLGQAAAKGERPLDPEKLRGRLDEARRLSLILGRLIAAAVLGAATALLSTAATSTLVLGPRWLGGVLAGLALLFLVMTVQEVIALRREVRARRLRARARVVVLDEEPPDRRAG